MSEYVVRSITKDTKTELRRSSGYLLQKVLSLGGHICGGFPLGILRDDIYEASDIDIYPSDSSSRTAIDRCLKHELNYNIVDETHCAVTYLSARTYLYGHRPVQIIKLCAPKPEVVMDSFDFSVCQVALVTPDKLLVSRRALEDLERRSFTVLNGWDDPFNLAYRASKYSAKWLSLNNLDAIRLMTLLEAELEGNPHSLSRMRGIECGAFSGGTNDIFLECKQEAYKSFLRRWNKQIASLAKKQRNSGFSF